MSRTHPPIPVPDPWRSLRRFTRARIALGRVGASLPTRAHLDFQRAHARARDAVRLALDFDALAAALTREGCAVLRLHSRAADRDTYLQRPDLGRLLDDASIARLRRAAERLPPPDVVPVICDGLSSMAIAGQAAAFAARLAAALAGRGLRAAPVCLVAQGRVAVGDPVGEVLAARMAVVMIGERPGLSSPDSMGIYFTYAPRTGATDADRNCISNIHAGGLSHEEALAKLLYLMAEADRRRISGVRLKDETPLRARLEP